MSVPGHLPHRYPFLLVDRVLEREPGVRVVAEKLVTAGGLKRVLEIATEIAIVIANCL